jgi:hypothetical protein
MSKCESNREEERQEKRGHTVKLLDIGVHRSLVLDLVSSLVPEFSRDHLIAVQILVCLQGSNPIRDIVDVVVRRSNRKLVQKGGDCWRRIGGSGRCPNQNRRWWIENRVPFVRIDDCRIDDGSSDGRIGWGRRRLAIVFVTNGLLCSPDFSSMGCRCTRREGRRRRVFPGCCVQRKGPRDILRLPRLYFDLLVCDLVKKRGKRGGRSLTGEEREEIRKSIDRSIDQSNAPWTKVPEAMHPKIQRHHALTPLPFYHHSLPLCHCSLWMHLLLVQPYSAAVYWSG